MNLSKIIIFVTLKIILINTQEVNNENKFVDNNKLLQNWNSFIVQSKRADNIINNNDIDNAQLHLTINEIEDILKKRAKERAAQKNVKLNSEELNLLIEKASVKVPKYFIKKRAINYLLLNEKVKPSEETLQRVPKSINIPLLNVKAVAEENEKYLQQFKNLQQIVKKSKRDINLDLLKQRSQNRERKLEKSDLIVQPFYLHEKPNFQEEILSKENSFITDSLENIFNQENSKENYKKTETEIPNKNKKTIEQINFSLKEVIQKELKKLTDNNEKNLKNWDFKLEKKQELINNKEPQFLCDDFISLEEMIKNLPERKKRDINTEINNLKNSNYYLNKILGEDKTKFVKEMYENIKNKLTNFGESVKEHWNKLF